MALVGTNPVAERVQDLLFSFEQLHEFPILVDQATGNSVQAVVLAYRVQHLDQFILLQLPIATADINQARAMRVTNQPSSRL